MTIIFIDNKRKYKFMLGYKVKVGNKVYEIIGIELLRWKEAIGSLAATTSTTKKFNSYMTPLDNYIYFVEGVAIDGNCGFQWEYPEGQKHHTPRGQTIYIYSDEANILQPMYLPVLVIKPSYPTIAVYNPTAAANNSDFYFIGEKWQVKELDPSIAATLSPSQYTEMFDYANPKGIGQG